MEAKQQQQLEQYRSCLNDAIALVTKLAPFCASVEELLNLLQQASENDGTLRMVINTLTQKK